jgi:hypothetical protein
LLLSEGKPRIDGNPRANDLLLRAAALETSAEMEPS